MRQTMETTPATANALAEMTHFASSASVRDLIADNPDHTLFYEVAEAVGIIDMLASDAGFTLFLPTDDALEEMALDINLGETLSPEEKEQLFDFIASHIVSDEITDLDSPDRRVSTETLAGVPITIDADGKTVRVNDASIVEAKLIAGNGVIHIIDATLAVPGSDQLH